MSSSSEVRFEFRECKPMRSPGPLEKLWQSTSGFGTVFLSGDEAHRREQDARSLGIQETEVRLLAEQERKMTLLRSEIAVALAAFERQRQQYFQHIESEVVRLAITIARQAIGREMKLDPALLSGTVQEVLQRLDREGAANIRISPSEVAAWERALTVESAGTTFTIVADPGLTAGKCVLETSVGTTVLDPLSELDDIEGALMRVANPDAPPAESAMVQ